MTRGLVVNFVADGGYVGVFGARAYCSAWGGKVGGVGLVGWDGRLDSLCRNLP